MRRTVSTGVPSLDRRLNGGMYPGSLLAFVAPPGSQSEAILHALMCERSSLYISTIRQRRAVEQHLEDAVDCPAEYTVEYVGRHSSMDNEFLRAVTGERSYSFGESAEAPLDAVYEAVTGTDRYRNLIVDPMNPLEKTSKEGKYKTVLNTMKEVALERDGIAALHCTALDTQPPLRELTLTVADVVWNLEIVSTRSGIEFHLTIPKNRNGTVIDEEISIEFGRRVSVDDSRTI